MTFVYRWVANVNPKLHNTYDMCTSDYIIMTLCISYVLCYAISFVLTYNKVQNKTKTKYVFSDTASTTEHTATPVGLIVGSTLGLILIFGIVILLLVVIIRYVPKYYNITASNPYNAELFLSKQWSLKGFSFWSYHKCLS